MKQVKRVILSSMVALTALVGCTAEELEAISAGLAQGLAEAANENSYNQRNYYGNPYRPGGFANYGGWPSYYSYGDYVGYYGCRSTGTFYTCDSDGDGYADMYGNTADGSYASSNLRVNGRGEAFTWDSGCGCWVRNRAYDGPRREYYDRYDKY